MHSPKYYQELIEKEISALSIPGSPPELYEPIRYMLSLGGKRLRPCLVLMANELFGGDISKAIGPALGIEVFHNFTLLHDDIMDNAPLRRGKATVFTKWNPNIAILSGDTMFVKSCQLMMDAEDSKRGPVLDLFFKTAAEVCEGQQFDMNFESREIVSIQEYLEMISLKTAVLLGCSLQIGSILAGAGPENAQHMYNFGKNLGIAFQLHDDILDLYAESEKFGKQVGGDILSNKKTILLLHALAHDDNEKVNELKKWLETGKAEPELKIPAVTAIFESMGVRRKAETDMENYFLRAMNDFQKVEAESSKKEMLSELAERLMVREA
ncbi:MAG TPA: polyprenyl synthetase family protein [Bacteroidia bacterium]|nr:polyprenyl synthetase family protein [Bacteroidia bacterium]